MESQKELQLYTVHEQYFHRYYIYVSFLHF